MKTARTAKSTALKVAVTSTPESNAACAECSSSALRSEGSCPAISETAYEFGTVLGTVVIGGMLTAIYRAQVMVPAGLNADAAHAAGETLGGATAVAGQLPSDLSAELLHSAHAAFDSGVLVTATFSAVLLAVLLGLHLPDAPLGTRRTGESRALEKLRC